MGPINVWLSVLHGCGRPRGVEGVGATKEGVEQLPIDVLDNLDGASPQWSLCSNQEPE
jgi:hypothetical protein